MACVGAAGIALLLVITGVFFRPKVHRVVTPSGRAYDLLSDLVSSDGHYFIKYLARSTNADELDQSAHDLLALVTSDPRSSSLRTISIEGNVGYGIGAFTIYRGYGYVFENARGKWIRGDEQAVHDSLVRGGAAEVGSSHE